jgi:prevent-host-death family protein
MVAVGIRELKVHLSRYLRRIGRGERLLVTDRGRPVAVISPAAGPARDEKLDDLLRDGTARWDGGKPRGISRPVRVRGPSVAEAVIEDRR